MALSLVHYALAAIKLIVFESRPTDVCSAHYRHSNSIRNLGHAMLGLPVLECDEVDIISAGDVLEVDLLSGVINNSTTGETYQAAALSETVATVLNAGGLVPFLERRYGVTKQT